MIASGIVSPRRARPPSITGACPRPGGVGSWRIRSRTSSVTTGPSSLSSATGCRHATANVENVWNGRPMSKILLAQPLVVLDGALVPLIELIPPIHQRVYRMGLEHLGVVIGDGVEEFSRVHRRALTGQQFQSPDNEPYYALFEDFTHVKFYRRSLRDVCELDGARFDGFHHVEGWVPQRIITATGPDPLPR